MGAVLDYFIMNGFNWGRGEPGTSPKYAYGLVVLCTVYGFFVYLCSAWLYFAVQVTTTACGDQREAR